MQSKALLKVILFVFIANFLQAQSNTKGIEYKSEIKAWDASRISTLKSANGWVNLAGLF